MNVTIANRRRLPAIPLHSSHISFDDFTCFSHVNLNCVSQSMYSDVCKYRRRRSEKLFTARVVTWGRMKHEKELKGNPIAHIIVKEENERKVIREAICLHLETAFFSSRLRAKLGGE